MRINKGSGWLFFILMAVATISPQQIHAQHVTVSTTHTTENIAAGVVDGRLAADSKGSGGYFVGGLASGFLGGLIGTAIVYAVASGSDATLPASELMIASKKGDEYFLGYQQGFAERIRQNRKRAAVGGGLVGTAAVLALFLSAPGY